MKLFIGVLLSISTWHLAAAQDSRIISDCTVNYEVSVQDPNADPQVIKSMSSAQKTLYIKGTRSRTDFITPSFKQTTFYDSRTDSTVVLRELGNTKYITYLNSDKVQEQNKKYEGITFTPTSDKKTILGYECSKVIARLADGSAYNIFYTSTIAPSTKGFEYQFKDLPGFVLEYEADGEGGKTKVRYSATKISLLPVPIALFDVPKSGYRII